MHKGYRLVVFDWDGTLMDSLARIVSCMQLAALDLELEPANDQAVRDIIGLALDIAIRTLHPELTPAQVEALRARYAHHYVEAERVPTTFFDGALPMLRRIASSGCRLSVATGKSRKGLDRSLRAHNLETFFHSSRCADETASKPEPDMLLELMAQHQLKPAELVMVGDTEFDLEMARRAGVDRVGVGWGSHGIERLQAHEPEIVVESMVALENWLLARVASV